MLRSASTARLNQGLLAVATALALSPAALAGSTSGTGGTVNLAAANGLQTFLVGVAGLFSGPIGVAIGVIAFVVVGVYIMYARQTGQAIGAVGKVFMGLLIVFGAAKMVTEIGGATGGLF